MADSITLIRVVAFGTRQFVATETPSGCWVCICHVAGTGGYPVTLVGGKAGKKHPIHRAIWAHLNGPIPAGLVIRHRCDVKTCINPDHLEIGTQADNVRDRDSRGRTATGERHPRAKLKWEQVREIRRRRATGEGQRALGREFGISHTVVQGIIAGRLWREV